MWQNNPLQADIILWRRTFLFSYTSLRGVGLWALKRLDGNRNIFLCLLDIRRRWCFHFGDNDQIHNPFSVDQLLYIRVIQTLTTIDVRAAAAADHAESKAQIKTNVLGNRITSTPLSIASSVAGRSHEGLNIVVLTDESRFCLHARDGHYV